MSLIGMLKNKLSLIALIGLGLSACDHMKPESSVHYSNSKEYQYHINVGNPNGYNVVFEYENSYFKGNDGELLLIFGGNVATGGGWGNGSQNTSLSGQYSLPKGFKVRWYSVVEDQFWEGDFDFPRELLSVLFNDGFLDIDNGNQRESYSSFTINVAPGGLVSVWLEGGSQTVQLGVYQAHKIAMDWDAFTKFSLEYNIDRADYRALVLGDLADNHIVKQEIKAGKVPIDSAPWRGLQKKYDWRFNINLPFKLIDYRTWYANAESYYTYPDEVSTYQFRAPPYRISMHVVLPNGSKEELQLWIDKDQIVEVFGKYGQVGKLELNLWLSNDLSEAELYVAQGDVQVKVDILEIYLSDMN